MAAENSKGQGGPADESRFASAFTDSLTKVPIAFPPGLDAPAERTEPRPIQRINSTREPEGSSQITDYNVAATRLIADLLSKFRDPNTFLNILTDADGVLFEVPASGNLKEHISVQSHRTRPGRSVHQRHRTPTTVNDNFGKLKRRIFGHSIFGIITAATLDKFLPSSFIADLTKSKSELINKKDPGIIAYQGEGDYFGEHWDWVGGSFGMAVAIFERLDIALQKIARGEPLNLEDIKTEFRHFLYADQTDPTDPSKIKQACEIWIQNFDSEEIIALLAKIWMESENSEAIFNIDLALAAHLRDLDNPTQREIEDVIRNYSEKQQFGFVGHGVQGRISETELSPLGKLVAPEFDKIVERFAKLGVDVETFYYEYLMGFNLKGSDTKGSITGVSKVDDFKLRVDQGLVRFNLDGPNMVFYVGDSGTDKTLMLFLQNDLDDYLEEKFGQKIDCTVFCVGVGHKVDFSDHADIVVDNIDTLASFIGVLSKSGIPLGSQGYPYMQQQAALELEQIGLWMVDAKRAWQFVAGTEMAMDITPIGIEKSQKDVLQIKYTDKLLRKARALYGAWQRLEKKDEVTEKAARSLLNRNHGIGSRAL